MPAKHRISPADPTLPLLAEMERIREKAHRLGEETQRRTARLLAEGPGARRESTGRGRGPHDRT